MPPGQWEGLSEAIVLQLEHIRTCGRASANAPSKAESGLGRDFAVLVSSQGPAGAQQPPW